MATLADGSSHPPGRILAATVPELASCHVTHVVKRKPFATINSSGSDAMKAYGRVLEGRGWPIGWVRVKVLTDHGTAI